MADGTPGPLTGSQTAPQSQISPTSPATVRSFEERYPGIYVRRKRKPLSPGLSASRSDGSFSSSDSVTITSLQHDIQPPSIPDAAHAEPSSSNVEEPSSSSSSALAPPHLSAACPEGIPPRPKCRMPGHDFPRPVDYAQSTAACLHSPKGPLGCTSALAIRPESQSSVHAVHGFPPPFHTHTIPAPVPLFPRPPVAKPAATSRPQCIPVVSGTPLIATASEAVSTQPSQSSQQVSYLPPLDAQSALRVSALRAIRAHFFAQQRPPPRQAVPSAQPPLPQQPRRESAPGQAERPDPLKYKTRLCWNFVRNGCCRYELRCCFAHGSSDLRDVYGNRRQLEAIDYFSNAELQAMVEGPSASLPIYQLFQQIEARGQATE